MTFNSGLGQERRGKGVTLGYIWAARVPSKRVGIYNYRNLLGDDSGGLYVGTCLHPSYRRLRTVTLYPLTVRIVSLGEEHLALAHSVDSCPREGVPTCPGCPCTSGVQWSHCSQQVPSLRNRPLVTPYPDSPISPTGVPSRLETCWWQVSNTSWITFASSPASSSPESTLFTFCFQ